MSTEISLAQSSALPVQEADLIQTLLNNTGEAVIVCDLNCFILVWNREAEKVFGYRSDEILGQKFETLLRQEDRQQVLEAIQGLRNSGGPARYHAAMPTKGERRIQADVTLSNLPADSKKQGGFVAVIRDLTAYLATEKALASRLRQQAGLAWLGQQALAEVDFDTLLDVAVNLVKRTLEVDLVKVLELEPDGQNLMLKACSGCREGLVGRARVSAGPESHAGFTLLSHKPLVISDFNRERRFETFQILAEHGITSGINTVIEGSSIGRPYGVIGAYSQQRRSFSQDDLNFLQTVASMLASAIRQEKAVADHIARVKAEEHVREMQAAAQQRTVLLDTANHVALNILSSRMGTEALQHIAEAARMLADSRYAALGVAYEDKPGLEQFITSGLTPEDEAKIGDLPRGAGVLGVLLEQDQPLRIDNLGDHPASVGFPPHHPPMSSFLGVPIRRENMTIGSLYLTNKQSGGGFTEADEAAVSALGAYAAVAIHNLRLLSRQRELTRSLLTAQEEERRAVAHDLHDGLTQFVMASHAHLEASKRAHANGDAEKAATQVDKGVEYLQQAVVESRRLINNLRLLVLDDLGLIGALEQLVQEESSRAGWEESHLDTNIGEERFDTAIETGVYRIAQEALTNARKHAQTTKIQLSLWKQSHGHITTLQLEVRDWGNGFAPGDGAASSGHFGLQSMIERIHLLNGTSEIDTAPDAGTTIRATFRL